MWHFPEIESNISNLDATYTTFLSCFSSLLVNSLRISRNRRHGGGADGSSAASLLFCTANRIPARCKTIIASRFLTASNPNDSANRFANSYWIKLNFELVFGNVFVVTNADYLQIGKRLGTFRHIYWIVRCLHIFVRGHQTQDHGECTIYFADFTCFAHGRFYDVAVFVVTLQN